MDTSKILDLCRNVILYFEKTYFNRYIEDYKTYLCYTGDRKKDIKEWQSNVFFPMTSGIINTMYSNMYDSKIKFNLEGGIEGTETLLNRSFDYSNKGKEAIWDAIKEGIIVGKGYVKPIMVKRKEKKVVKGKDYGKEFKLPMLQYISVFNLFYDYNSGLYDSPFTIERYILSRKGIKDKYLAEIEKAGKDIDYIDSILAKEPQRFSEYDPNRVKHILSYGELINKGYQTSLYVQANTVTGEGITDRNNVFAVDFEKNKVYEVIEYTGEDDTHVIINGHLLYKKKKTINIDETLICEVIYNKVSGTSDAIGVASELTGLQKIQNSIYNIYLDNLKMKIAPMFEQTGGVNQILGKKGTLTYNPYAVISTNTPGGLKKLDLGFEMNEALNTLTYNQSNGERLIGVNDYVMGGGSKIERVSGGVEMRATQFKTRLMPFSNSITDAMAKVAKILLLMYAEYFTKEELIKLGLVGEMDYEQFLNEENVTFSLSSLALLDKEENLNKLLENMHNVLPMDDGTINRGEFVKAYLTGDIDIDKIMTAKKQQWSPGGGGQGGDIDSLLSSLKPNPEQGAMQ